MRFRRSFAVSIGLLAAIIPATSVFAATAAPSKVLYNSLVPAPGNLPSIGFEATQAAQFGNEITLTRSAKVATVVVTMDSWGCQTRTGTANTCVTSPGSTFSEPITLNIFQAPASNPTTQADSVGNGLPGPTIVSVTKTFAIPYRPSANNTKCIGDEAGNWFDPKNGECFPGLATNITFNLSSLKVTLPKTFVFGIAYNTSDYGAAPYGDNTACYATTEGCGYYFLNVGLSSDPDNLNVGSNPYPGYVWWNSRRPTTTAMAARRVPAPSGSIRRAPRPAGASAGTARRQRTTRRPGTCRRLSSPPANSSLSPDGVTRRRSPLPPGRHRPALANAGPRE